MRCASCVRVPRRAFDATRPQRRPFVERDSAVRSPKLKRRLRTGSHTFITLGSCHVRLPLDLMSAAGFAHDTALS